MSAAKWRHSFCVYLLMGEQIQKVFPLVRISRLLFSVQQQNGVSQVYHQPSSTPKLNTSNANHQQKLFYFIPMCIKIFLQILKTVENCLKLEFQDLGHAHFFTNQGLKKQVLLKEPADINFSWDKTGLFKKYQKFWVKISHNATIVLILSLINHISFLRPNNDCLSCYFCQPKRILLLQGSTTL
jgi:hypothetical protein